MNIELKSSCGGELGKSGSVPESSEESGSVNIIKKSLGLSMMQEFSVHIMKIRSHLVQWI